MEWIWKRISEPKYLLCTFLNKIAKLVTSQIIWLKLKSEKDVRLIKFYFLKGLEYDFQYLLGQYS